MSQTFEHLVELGEGKLRDLWREGTVPPPEELAGWIFWGINTSLLARRSPLAGARFAKGFFWAEGSLYGCNFPVANRDGIRHLDGERPFGFFQIYPTGRSRRWPEHPQGLLLDYSRGRGREFRAQTGVHLSPRLRLTDRLAGPLRDVLVRPPGAADGVFLGRAFLTSTLKLPVTCFVLERWRPLEGPIARRATRPMSISHRRDAT